MSSPNEPGRPRTGERPGAANGSVAGNERTPAGAEPRSAAGSGPDASPESGSVPPWQRGAARPPAGHRAESPARPEGARPDGSRPDVPRPAGAGTASAGPGGGGEARPNRFTGGTPGQDSEQAPRGERPDTGRDAAYASEIPDLSGPGPRPPHRKPPERPGTDPQSRLGAPTSRIQVANRPRGPVRASMQIRRVDPWSVLKVSLVLSVALFFVWMIAVAFLYLVLGGMGVWSKLNSNVGDLLTSASGTTGAELVSSGTIFGGAALIGLVNIVLLSAMATIGAFVYNLTTDLVGGVEVTLADRD